MSARGAGPAHLAPTTDLIRANRTIIFRGCIGSFKYDVLGLTLRTGDRVVEFPVVLRRIIVAFPQVRRVFVEQPRGAERVSGKYFEVYSTVKAAFEILQVGDVIRPQ